MGDTYFISQFVKGLKPKIINQVQGQVPATMERVVMLAKIQQQIQEKSKGRGQRQYSNNKLLTGTSQKPEFSKPPFVSQLPRERQLRDFCRANNLCFYSKEPYDPTHPAKCLKKPKAQVNDLVINELDVDLTDEVLNELAVEDSIADDLYKLSLNAISGTKEGEAMKLRVLVQNKVMLMLVDSGSSHTFVRSAFVARLGLNTIPTSPKTVKVANGDTLVTDQFIPQMEWWIQGHSFHTDMLVLEMGVYDCILGFNWLKSISSVMHDWEARTMEFSAKGKPVKLHGVEPAPLSLQEIQADTLVKWATGNDIWAWAVVDMSPPSEEDAIPPEVQQILQDNQDVFAEPKGLPPPRLHDHTIPTLTDSILVNS
jgi:hypothetical protein